MIYVFKQNGTRASVLQLFSQRVIDNEICQLEWSNWHPVSNTTVTNEIGEDKFCTEVRNLRYAGERDSGGPLVDRRNPKNPKLVALISQIDDTDWPNKRPDVHTNLSHFQE